MFGSLFFITFKNNLTDILLNVKNKVIKQFLCPIASAILREHDTG